MSRFLRQLVLMGLDTLAGIAAVLLAFVIRFAVDGREVPMDAVFVYLYALPVLIPVRIVIYHLVGLYRQVWSQASVPEMLRIIWAALLNTTALAVIIYLVIAPEIGFPRSVVVISGILNIAGLLTIRLVIRLRREYCQQRYKQPMKAEHRTIIFGAGDAGVMLAREFAKHRELGHTIIGFIDDDAQKIGYRVGGVPVLGERADLPEVVRRHSPTHLIIATPSVKGTVVREVVDSARNLGLQLKTVPGLYELVNGTVNVSQIRDVQIEDLLGRAEIKVDLEAISGYLSGETVLVTGAGGSIGSELCRQVARFGAKRLVLLGHGENSIYEIHLELQGKFPGVELCPVIADIQDEARIRRVFEQFRPAVVFHAAAHKHVPLMEQNPEEAIKNNIYGTLHVARAADFYKAKRFVLISSDKAVNPTSIMGATKRGAEYVVQSLARTSKTVFVAVRFGNVLGSRGSVIPLFKRQIAAGGPVTVTDPKMIRYFMTIPEAVQLVIQAASMGHGGEVFVLDMGKPVRIDELARDLIRLSGFVPDVDIQIEYTGIRPGEKMFEELLTAEEGTAATVHERIYVAKGDPLSPAELQSFLGQMDRLAASGEAANQRIRSTVMDVVEKGTQLHGAVGAGN